LTIHLCLMLRMRLCRAVWLLLPCAVMACVGQLGLYLCIIEWMKFCYYWTVDIFSDIWLTDFLDPVQCPLFKIRKTKMLVLVLNQKVMGRT
jgi:hypothetical protein